MSSIELAHHDGSALYVDNQAPDLGDKLNVWARVPAAGGARQVYVRFIQDGEARFVEASLDRTSRDEQWWRANVELRNPVTGYRFLLRLASGGYRWLNGSGVHAHDVTDAEDFRALPFTPPASWADSAVVYQIFMDRFASSGVRRDVPSWAVPADWYQSEVAHRGPLTSRQLYGGDFAGAEARLGYIQELGPTVVYLTPFFPASSNHRYDAETFETVEPLLGGDEALASFSSAAHGCGIRVMGDLTTNHTGVGHEWFRTAQADDGSAEHGFYYWRESPPGYESWLDHARLPKLNYSSSVLWDRMVKGGSSVTARWLQAPYHLDGWRVDVANMTGRFRSDNF